MDIETKQLPESHLSEPDAVNEVVDEQRVNNTDTIGKLRENFSRQEGKLSTLQDFVQAGNSELKLSLESLVDKLVFLEGQLMVVEWEVRTSAHHHEEKLATLQDLLKESTARLEVKLSRQEEKLDSLETLLKNITQEMVTPATCESCQQTDLESEPRNLSAGELSESNSQTETPAEVTSLKVQAHSVFTELATMDRRMKDMSDSLQDSLAAIGKTMDRREKQFDSYVASLRQQMKIMSLVLGDKYDQAERKWFLEAVENGDEAVVQAWINDGKSLEVTDGSDRKKSMTALHKASRNGHSAMVGMLISAGANVNARDTNGATPLHLAVEHERVEIVEKLVKAGADLSLKADEGWTPLHHAVRKGLKEIVELMLKSGANPNERTDYKRTSLHVAARFGKTEIAKVLLAAGANKVAFDSFWKSPGAVASDNGYSELARLLSP